MRLFSGKLLLALFLASAPIVSQAQPNMAQGQVQFSQEQQQMMMQMQQAQIALQQTQQKLQSMQTQAIEKSPELQKKRDTLRSKMTDKMNSGGYDADAELKALNDIIQKYEANGEKPSQEVIVDFQKRQKAFQQKQAEAMQSEEIQTMAQNFEKSVMQAVEKNNPESASLIATLRQQVADVQKLRKQFQETMTK